MLFIRNYSKIFWMLGSKDAIRIVPYFVLLQFYPIFAYREAYAPLLCSYRGGSLSHKTTFVQAHRGFRLLTLASTYYNITLFLSVNIRKKLLVSRQISDDIKQFSYEICQRHSVIIRYMEKISSIFTKTILERTYLLDRWIFCL